MYKAGWSLILALILTGIALLAMSIDYFGMYYDLALASTFFVFVLCVPFCFRELRWYEPVLAMNAMFLLFGFAALYFAFTGFTTAEHSVHTDLALAEKAPYTVLYVASWLLMFYLGYAALRKIPQQDASDEAIVEPLAGISSGLLKVSVCVCFLIALFNLIYNVWLFNPQDPLKYFINFGVSKYRVQANEGIYTTLGYNLFVVSLILYRFSFKTWNLRRILTFSILLAAALVAVLSRGQIFYTFSVVMFVLVLEYFFSASRDRYFRWALGVLPALFFIMVFAYFFRLVSVEMYLAEKFDQPFDFWSSFSGKLASFGGLLFGKGNVPNLPAMILYQDHFGKVDKYLWGGSLASWLSAFLPYFDATYIGYKISDVWYPNNVGGIPPGVVHESYANFGFTGGLVFSSILGALAAVTFNYFSRNKNVVVCIIYSALLVRFWFILPKVEFAVLSNAIWLFLPSVTVFLIIYSVIRIRSLWISKS